MKRAAGLKIFAALFQRNALVYHLDDVDAREQFVDKFPGNFAAHRLSCLIDQQDISIQVFADLIP